MARTQAEARPNSRTHDRRRAAAVVLAVAVGLALCAGGAAAWRLAAAEKVAAVGAVVAIPGGQLQVDEITHVGPDTLGGVLPVGTHAVQLSMTVSADQQAPTIVSADDFTVVGTGVPAPIVASRATPQEATVPRGTSISVVLVFAVPDLSTDLVLTVPGGALVTAEHADHPGDRSN
jgi:hypothetical protein